MPRCAIYARFSTDRQSATSAEDQVAACRTRAEREGWDVVDVYSDLAISGASNRRPGMTAMLADAAAGSFDIVLAEALDRIARNQADVAQIYQRLEFAGVAIETLSEGRVNELHIGLKGTMGALFLKELADKIRRGQRGSLSRGRIPGGRCYGYDVVTALGPDGKVERGVRVVNEEQAAVVRRIVREYIAGRSPKKIAHGLNADGIPSAMGGEWRASAIVGSRARQIGILHNPIYAGRFVYGRVRMLRDPESRNRVSRPNPADERATIDLPELRIITDADWQAIQDLVAMRSSGPLPQARRPRSMLSGLVYCAECGGRYTAHWGKRMGCARHREAGTCTNGRRIDRAELERRVLAGISEQLLAPEALALLRREYHHEAERQATEFRRDRAAIERRLARADGAVGRLVAAIERGAADFAEIREALAARKADAADARAELAELDAVPVIALNPAIVDVYRERVRALVEEGPSGDITADSVGGQIRGLIDAVYVKPGEGRASDVEVVSSLSSIVALANGDANPGGSIRRVLMVAEDRYVQYRKARSIKV